MTRSTLAARSLMQEVSREYPKAKFGHDNPDGLNIFRTLTIEGVDDVGSDALRSLTVDERIASVEIGDGSAVIEFVDTIAADRRNFFHFASAMKVLDVEVEGEDVEPDLRSMTKTDLVSLYGDVIEGAEKMRKGDLIDAIEAL